MGNLLGLLKQRERENLEQKVRKQVENEFLQYFHDHRVALQEYRSKLISYHQDLERQSDELDERERAINKRELNVSQKESTVEKAIQQSRKDFIAAIYNTELRSLDWIKRVDRKETAAFEEIRQSVEKFNKYNDNPSENGFQFEENFAVLLTLNGYVNVQVTQRSNDFGADIIAEKDGIIYSIQCKYYTSPVGIEAVQQIYAARIYYAAHVAVVATNSVFTKSAKVLAEKSGVALWDGEFIEKMKKSANPSFTQ